MWSLLFLLGLLAAVLFFAYKVIQPDWNPPADAYPVRQVQDPYPDDAPWPAMRGDPSNSGRSRQLDLSDRAVTAGELVHFPTGNAIFSTPVIDAQERVYVGSADHKFYALDPHEGGTVLWTRDVGEIIDSAACLGPDGTIYVAAGDGKVHAYAPDGRELWTYDAVHDRAPQQFSFSTNFWFEANVVVGPDGALYVANDDFFLYKMTPAGEILWGFRTGFLIWSAAAFLQDGTVLIAGFDHFLYALDPNTGQLRWSKDLQGALVASPTVGNDGTIYQASFNGNVYAIDGRTRETKWVLETGSHVYASPALAPDNALYVGSTNGTFYAVDVTTGAIRWTYYIGDAIRASAAVGPDPRGVQPYLVYFGGGDGRVYALEPTGTPRWSYNTLEKARDTDYPNINASVALGHSGLVVACSTGDVVWIPYDYYERPDAVGIQVKAGVDTTLEGLHWHYVTPGGRFDRAPLQAGQEILPVNTISLRLIHHAGGRMSPAPLVPDSLAVTADPPFEHRLHLQSDGVTLNVVPEAILHPGTTYRLTVAVDHEVLACDNEAAGEEPSAGMDRPAVTTEPARPARHFVQELAFQTRPVPGKTSLVAREPQCYDIVHMASPQPAIFPSLDQIGLASLTIPFTIVETDPARDTFVGWAVQKFGEAGVPQKRVSLYAFAGRVADDYFVMDSKNCLFEITSFNVPLNLFRVAGLLRPDGTLAPGGTLLIEKDWDIGNFTLMRELGSASPLTPRNLLALLKAGGLVQFVKAALRFFPALVRQFLRGTWDQWGLMNHAGQFLGVGTFKLRPRAPPETPPPGYSVTRFTADPANACVVGELAVPAGYDRWRTPLGILLVNARTSRPVSLKYTTAVKYKRLGPRAIRVTLTVPKVVVTAVRHFRAHLLVDLARVASTEFQFRA